jgi:hypothetical protein
MSTQYRHHHYTFFGSWVRPVVEEGRRPSAGPLLDHR